MEIWRQLNRPFGNQRLISVVGVMLILWLATFLRAYHLDQQSFWNDEGNSARLSERSLTLIIEGTASDVHPPLYYLILRGWREFIGDSEFSLRLWSVLTGVLTVATTITCGRLLLPSNTRRGAGAMAALAVTLSPALIYYSQEARMYSQLGFLTLLSTMSLLQWQRRWHKTQTPSWPAAIVYTVAATAGLYTHYFFPTIVGLHGLWIGAWLLFRPLNEDESWTGPLWHWAGLFFSVFILYLPWLPVFLRMGSGGRPPDNASLSDFAFRAGRWLMVGRTLPDDNGSLIFLAVIALGTIVALWRFRQKRTTQAHMAILYSWVLIPPLAMWVVGATLDSYLKFMTGLIPAVWLLASYLWVAFQPNRAFQAVLYHISATTVGLLLVSLTIASLHNLYNNPTFFRADYRAIATQITNDNHPNAGIILNAPNQWEVFTYYYQGLMPTYPFPRVRSDVHTIEGELQQLAGQHTRLYALFWGETERDPERTVERWLDANGFKAVDEWRGDVRFVMYALPADMASTDPLEIAQPLQVSFGQDERIVLEGVTTTTDIYRPGDVLQLTLFWKATQPISTRYKIFLHLLTADGHLVAQRDSEPVGNLAPTTQWEVGKLVHDNHGLLIPADLPSGTYKLVVGLYNLEAPHERLNLGADHPSQDYYELLPLHID